MTAPPLPETLELDDQPVFLLRAGDDPVPVVYLHGVPTSADDWLPFLAATGGIALDLPGFGRTGKRGDGDFTVGGWARWLPRALDAAGAGRVRLVGHDWGALVALRAAAAHPDRVERMVLIDPSAPRPTHRLARLLRVPGLGEFAVGLSAAPVLRRVLASGTVAHEVPRPWADDVAARFDQGTQRAVLSILRAAPPDADRPPVPTLVVHGADDPWTEPAVGRALAAALPDAAYEEIAGGGHWPWLEDPGVVARVAAFLEG